MNEQDPIELLAQNGFRQLGVSRRFKRDTQLGELTLLFQPLRKTKYVGEIRYRKSAGCRVTLSLMLYIPSRFTITDIEIGNYRFISYLHKKRKNKKIGLSHSKLIAWAPAKEWTENILNSDSVTSSLPYLFSEEINKRKQQSLILDPINLSYAYRMQEIDLNEILDLVPYFLRIGSAIKQGGVPPQLFTLSKLEKFMSNHPYLLAVLIMFGLMILLLLPVLSILFFAVSFSR